MARKSGWVVARHSVRPSVLFGLLAMVVAMELPSQAPVLGLDLRDGSTLTAIVVGGDDKGLDLTVDGRTRRVEAREVLAIRAATARSPQLLRAELVDGDSLFGVLAGGDTAGDRVELLSPVLGQLSIAVDRLQALVQPGVHAAEQLLPAGVDEALFVTTGRGYDLIVGTLHRFGAQGVLFQPELDAAPRWFGPEQFSSVRIAGVAADVELPPFTLLTRAADRLRVHVRQFGAEGLAVALVDGSEHRLAWTDVAALVGRDGVVHLGDLTPTEVAESGCDGDVVWPFRRDQCSVGGELLAGGKAWGLGIGAHSRSRLSFVVPAGAQFFRTRVAIDDSAGELGIEANAIARVLRGNEVLLLVDDLRPGVPPRDSGLLPVKPGETIVLEVDFGMGRDLGDRVDWLLPMFLLRAPS